MNIVDLQERLRMLSESIDGCDPESAERILTLLSRQHQGAEVQVPDLAMQDGRNAIVEEAAAQMRR